MLLRDVGYFEWKAQPGYDLRSLIGAALVTWFATSVHTATNGSAHDPFPHSYLAFVIWPSFAIPNLPMYHLLRQPRIRPNTVTDVANLGTVPLKVVDSGEANW
jgi:hypothetical protein